MTVWVLQQGMHDDRSVTGVFESAERAMQAWNEANAGLVCTWTLDPSGYWANGLRWDYAAQVTEWAMNDVARVWDR